MSGSHEIGLVPADHPVSIKVSKLAMDGLWEFVTRVDTGPRASLVVPFSAPEFIGAVGKEFVLGHLNLCTARAGVLRGIHYRQRVAGQSKYVFCQSGSYWDVAVDLRMGSPSFGKWLGTYLVGGSGKSVYLSEGFGHGFLALEDDSTLCYMSSEPFVPAREGRLNPWDLALGIKWPTSTLEGTAITPRAGQRDMSAGSLSEAIASGILPVFGT